MATLLPYVPLSVRRSLIYYLPPVLGRFLEPFPEYLLEPYVFEVPDSEETIVLVAKEGRMAAWSSGASLDVPAIRAATFTKLVERLTFHAYPDSELVDTFLLTYRSMASPTELLSALIRRYHVRRGTTAEDAERCHTIQSRVVNVLRTWIKNYWMDFDEPSVLALLNRFVDEKIIGTDGNDSLGAMLRDQISRQQVEWRQRSIPVLSMALDVVPPTVTLESLNERLLDFAPECVAEQVTLLRSDLFRSIPQYEFLSKVWKKASRTVSHPNLDRLIESFNSLSGWMVLSVLGFRRPEERAKALKYYIKAMRRFTDLNNFDGVMCVVSAFEGAAIHRLHRSWEGVSKEKMRVYEDLRGLMSHESSFKRYRAALRECAPPCVPYIGLYLTDLTFICDGNEDWYKKRGASSSSLTAAAPATPAAETPKAEAATTPGAFPVDRPVEAERMVNFDKRRMFARAVGEIKQYQNDRYADITPLHGLQQLILQVFAYASTVHENDTFEMSLEREPRQPKK